MKQTSLKNGELGLWYRSRRTRRLSRAPEWKFLVRAAEAFHPRMYLHLTDTDLFKNYKLNYYFKKLN